MEAPIYDISITVAPGTPEWPEDTPFSCRWAWDMAAGASVNVSAITSSPHVGTHADAPIHVKSGAIGADALPLHPFHGPALVVDVSDLKREIMFEVFRMRIGDVMPPRLLLKTGRTIADGHFPESWPAVGKTCAKNLIERGLVLLGVDCPSVDYRDSKTLAVHHTLFDGGTMVLENLDLRQVSPGPYELTAYPTKYAGLDAAPVRAVLRPLPRV